MSPVKAGTAGKRGPIATREEIEAALAGIEATLASIDAKLRDSTARELEAKERSHA